jgi:protein-S-isoprenylcysteine O-methyltransferase Ste14
VVPLTVVAAGEVLVALGFLVSYRVFKENSFSAATIAVAPDQRLVSTRPYAIVRHPMYAGALIMLFGTPLALGSWWALLMFIPMALTILWRARDEERFLIANLPGYEEYCQIVRYRLVPPVW